MVIDGKQVPMAGIIHSKLSFCLSLSGQAPWGFTLPATKLVGEEAGAGRYGMGNADGLFPGQ